MHDDPYGAVPQPKKIVEYKPDFRDEFYQQLPDMRSNVAREYPATLDRCIFDHANKRVYHHPGCEHTPDYGDEIRSPE